MQFIILPLSIFWWLLFSKSTLFLFWMGRCGFFSIFLIKSIFLCLKLDSKLILFFLFSFSFCLYQFNHISASRSRRKILFGFFTNTTINNDDGCTGIRSKGVTSVAWSGRPMGSSCTCSRYHSIIFTERYWFGTRRFTRFIHGKWRTQGNVSLWTLCCWLNIYTYHLCNEKSQLFLTLYNWKKKSKFIFKMQIRWTIEKLYYFCRRRFKNWPLKLSLWKLLIWKWIIVI